MYAQKSHTFCYRVTMITKEYSFEYFFFQFMGIIFFQTAKLLGPSYWINEIYGVFSGPESL